jgi:hypothetical protein
MNDGLELMSDADMPDDPPIPGGHSRAWIEQMLGLTRAPEHIVLDFTITPEGAQMAEDVQRLADTVRQGVGIPREFFGP